MDEGLLGRYLRLLRDDEEAFALLAAVAEQSGYGWHLARQEGLWRFWLPRLVESLAIFLAEFPKDDGRHSARGPSAEVCTELGLAAVSSFRRKETSFAVFFPLLKCLRRALFVSLDRIAQNPEESPPLRQGLAVFFDHLEQAAAVRWLRDDANSFQLRLREAKHFILNEKRRYATIFYKMGEPAFIIDQRLCFLDVNTAFEDFFKVRRETLLGKSCSQVLGQEICGACPLEDALVNHTSFSNIELAISVKGQPRTVLVNGTSLGYLSGEFPGGIVIIQDISEQKRVEQALQESEEKFRTLIENVPDVVWRADRDGNILFLGHNIKKISGYEAAELLGKSRFANIHADDREMVRARYAQLFLKGKELNLRYRLRRKNGAWIWVHDRARPTRYSRAGEYADGVLSDVSKLVRIEGELAEYRSWLEELVDERTLELKLVNEQLLLEVAERQQAQQALERLTASLSRSNAELEQFAQVASHDMKEPLLLIVAFAERLLARCRDNLDSMAEEYLRRIVKAARQLQVLVNDILQLARVDSAEQPFAVVALDRLLAEVLADLEERIHRSQGTITVGALHAVECNPTQMRQLFQNLISNALKYSKKDIPPLVEVRSRTLPGNLCEITVRDNGIGFSKEESARIFRPFVRLDSARAHEGSGVGLTTCEKIVARHGGMITAKSRPGEGSIFIIQLPLSQRQVRV
ncbi:PAS domain-containing sensor histidine kinase [Thiovibrio sp. JS02]